MASRRQQMGECPHPAGVGPVVSARSRVRRAFDRIVAAPSWRVALPVVAGFLALCALALAVHVPPMEWQPTLVVRPTKVFMLFALGVISAMWGASAFLRCTDSYIRHGIHGVMTLCLFWIIVTVVRYQLPHRSTLPWYLYYVPLTLVPWVILACAVRVAKLDRNRRMRLFLGACLVVGLALCLLVATNDLHHLAFVPIDEDWPEEYAYGPVYAMVCVLLAVQIVATLVVLVSAANVRLRSVLVVLACVAASIGLFSLGYVMRLGFVRNSSMPVFFVSVYLLVFELSLRTGLFPSCSDYQRVFDALTLDLRLFSAGDSREMATRAAVTRFPDMPSRAQSALSGGASLVTFHPAGRDNLMSWAYRVHGGVAVLSEDITAVIERRRRLEEQQGVLRRQNEVLSSFRRARTELLRRREELELHRSVEATLADATKAIGDVLDVLAPSDPSLEPISPEHRRHLLTILKLLVSFCKRKGGIELARSSDVMFERDRLVLMVNETMADLRTVGVDCAALVEVDQPLGMAASSTICDCLYAFAFMAIACDDPTLMLSLRYADAHAVELGVVLEDDDVAELADYRARRDLERGLSESGVTHSFRSGEKTVALTALMPREG